MHKKFYFNWKKLFEIIQYTCYGLIFGAGYQAELLGQTMTPVFGIIVASIGTAAVIAGAFDWDHIQEAHAAKTELLKTEKVYCDKPVERKAADITQTVSAEDLAQTVAAYESLLNNEEQGELED